MIASKTGDTLWEQIVSLRVTPILEAIQGILISRIVLGVGKNNFILAKPLRMTYAITLDPYLHVTEIKIKIKFTNYHNLS